MLRRADPSLYRDAFGGLPRLTWLLCTAAFLNRCGSMVVPFLGPYLKKQFQFTPTEAGWSSASTASAPSSAAGSAAA
jgi:hypothetical protein